MADETVDPGELNAPQPNSEALRAVGLKGEDEGARAQAEQGQPAGEAPTEGQPTPADAAALAALNQLMGKDFKTLEEASKSYKELESQFTAFRQLGISPEEAVERLRGEPEPAETGEEGEPEGVDYLARLADNPQGVIAETAQEAAVQVFQAMTLAHSLWQEFLQRHPEAPAHEPAMVKALDKNPNLIINPDTGKPYDDMLDRLYRFVNPKAGPTPEGEAHARADERERVLNQRGETHVERGTGGGLAPTPSENQKAVAEILQHARPMPVRR